MKANRRAEPISVRQTLNCWTGNGLERFPTVERALESLCRRCGRAHRDRPQAGSLDRLMTYFRRGFIPLSAPLKKRRQRGTAVIADPRLLHEPAFIRFIRSFGDWDFLCV